MAIGHGAALRYPSSGTEAVAGDRPVSFTPTGTPAGIVVILFADASAAAWTGVLYAGTAMTLTEARTDTTEVGAVSIYTLTGAAIPAGTQTVTIQGATTVAKWAEIYNVTSATNYSAVDSHNGVDTTTATAPSLVVATTASTTTCGYGGCTSGSPSVLAAGTGCTADGNNDYTARSAQSEHRTANDTGGNVTHAFTYGTSDDFCFAAVHLAEAAAPPAVVMPDLAMAQMTGA